MMTFREGERSFVTPQLDPLAPLSGQIVCLMVRMLSECDDGGMKRLMLLSLMEPLVTC